MSKEEIFQAILKGEKNVLNIFDNENVDVNIRDNINRTPLICACYPKVHLELIKGLIKRGADVNGCDSEKRAPLHYLCDKQEKHQVKKAIKILLLKGGANPNAQTKKLRTPLHLLCDKPHINMEIVGLLQEYRANFNIQDQNMETVLHFITKFKPEIKELIKCIYYWEDNKKKKSSEEVQEILGVDTNIVLEFVKFRADLNIQNRSGETPLHYLVQRKLTKQDIKILLKHNADFFIRKDKNDKHSTPYDSANGIIQEYITEGIQANKQNMRIFEKFDQYKKDIKDMINDEEKEKVDINPNIMIYSLKLLYKYQKENAQLYKERNKAQQDKANNEKFYKDRFEKLTEEKNKLIDENKKLKLEKEKNKRKKGKKEYSSYDEKRTNSSKKSHTRHKKHSHKSGSKGHGKHKSIHKENKSSKKKQKKQDSSSEK
ncbi:cyclin-dependent kinase inhibitor 2c-related [Anaeramoeba flamelloides]|uniref:Cyclin-dependent kinase inhibitor 2c-related n=1 Tax=Anaeramoeba flamelloides TaxID=1746091 RepID=A0AAV7Y1F3_9EUKA|nr:cyclin-dependent kinase inhibitor 2c-related [Anaeramoeba flamelloides]